MDRDLHTPASTRRALLRGLLLVLLLLCPLSPASAHRLDEYLQATLVSVEQDRVELSMRLIPGVAVSAEVIASIDTDHDGVLSPTEQQSYARRVLGDFSLRLDGRTLHPELRSFSFPSVQDIREGQGEIHLDFLAMLPAGAGTRHLVLENHDHRQRAVYLVNALAPTDPAIQIVAQKRNQLQSTYELDYTQEATGSAAPGTTASPGTLDTPGLAALFHLGMRHIAEGTDHLLFLLVLLLPAPLLVLGSRWAGPRRVKDSLLRVLRIVTAFTVGHSLTLALAASGVVHVPEQPVEILIAVSILVSAVHAIRPIFPGREALIAAFFGLIHGLAFASTLSLLGLGRWQRLLGVLAFNVGIETMQLAVVSAILPSLLLMSRTRAYPWLRVGGAVLAAAASLGWVVERTGSTRSLVDPLVDRVARHGIALAAGLLILSTLCWAFDRQRLPAPTPAHDPSSRPDLLPTD